MGIAGDDASTVPQRGNRRVGDARTDAALLLALREGDRTALRELYERYGDRVLAVARRRLAGDEDGARDVTQETFLALWRARATADPARGSPGGWLMWLARGAAADWYKAKRRRGRQDTEWMREDARTRTPPRGAPALLEGGELQARVRAALAQLPAEQRAVVEAVHFDLLSFAEAAERLGVAVGTVKSRHRLAMEKLEALLDDRLDPRRAA
ncbi:MAG TPA: sigma-70 family RNA polymerase sigma factor [Myxococcota bacterium]|jgi:RNA polymerase sigma-70 factor (ECF subfamily)|nr:sigma-70 family RNA polymerase sigma factor [Myxococcota bacterium]